MSDYRQCERCHAYKWGACKCVRFRCGVPFRNELDRHSLLSIWAMDAHDAAESYAELYDSDGDYTIIKRGSGEVWVLDEADVQTKWMIDAESVPTYHAYESATVPNPSEKPG